MSRTFTTPIPVPSPQSSPLSVLITGAARGLGLELVKQYAVAYEENIVIAAVRSINTATALTSFASSHSNVHIIQLDADNSESIRSSVKQVESFTDHLDILINNAAIFGSKDGVNPTTATEKEFSAVFKTNVIGVLLVTQTYLPLLLRSKGTPKVAQISSRLGSNEYANIFGKPTLSYGLSKAALNYLNTTFKYAVPTVAFLLLNPGWCDTDMGREASDTAVPPINTTDSVQALRYYIGEKGISNSGEFIDALSGKTIPY